MILGFGMDVWSAYGDGTASVVLRYSIESSRNSARKFKNHAVLLPCTQDSLRLSAPRFSALAFRASPVVMSCS